MKAKPLETRADRPGSRKQLPSRAQFSQRGRDSHFPTAHARPAGEVLLAPSSRPGNRGDGVVTARPVRSPSAATIDHRSERAAVVAAVIPAYRARRSITRVVERALGVADLVVVVDDACPQSTGDVVRGVDPRVRVIVHETNRGVGGATKTGIAAAMALGADYIVKIDADDQMDTQLRAAHDRHPRALARDRAGQGQPLRRSGHAADHARDQADRQLAPDAGDQVQQRLLDDRRPDQRLHRAAHRLAAADEHRRAVRALLLRDRPAVLVRAAQARDRRARDAGDLRRRAQLALDPASCWPRSRRCWSSASCAGFW